MSNLFYTGVGSRETPENIGAIMTALACVLERKGYILRSGAADGADTFFERGVVDPENKYIYLPWKGFNGSSSELYLDKLEQCTVKLAQDQMRTIHGGWDNLSQGAKKLHTRNIFQVCGHGVGLPKSKFLVCYAAKMKDGTPKGGTRTAWVKATMLNIPCFNLIEEKVQNRIIDFIYSNGGSV